MADCEVGLKQAGHLGSNRFMHKEGRLLYSEVERENTRHATAVGANGIGSYLSKYRTL
jgi:hypothetical protein